MLRRGCTYPDSTFSDAKSNGCDELKQSEGKKKKKKVVQCRLLLRVNTSECVWASLTTSAILPRGSRLEKKKKDARKRAG